MAASINKNGLLAGKVAVVTGASRGIGEAIALRYAQEGAKVVVSARTVEEGDHPLPGSINGVVQRIKDAGGEAVAVRSDLAVTQDREDLIKAATDAFGPVDILVNNAAITFFIPVVDFPERRWKLMNEVQVYAPFHLSQLVLPSMIERKTGWIVNVSSHAAIHPKLINETNEDRQTPVEHMAEACLRLSYSPATELSGRITYADDMMKEFKLEAAELLA